MSNSLVVHCKRASYDKYVGRPSLLGNPFVIGVDGNREQVVNKFEVYARERIALDADYAAEIAACYNKVLGCWCHPLFCHAEIIHKLAAELCEADKKGL